METGECRAYRLRAYIVYTLYPKRKAVVLRDRREIGSDGIGCVVSTALSAVLCLCTVLTTMTHVTSRSSRVCSHVSS